MNQNTPVNTCARLAGRTRTAPRRGAARPQAGRGAVSELTETPRGAGSAPRGSSRHGPPGCLGQPAPRWGAVARRLGALALLFVALGAHAQTRTVDFRFAPPYWYSATGVPDDWHKPLVSDEGALLYDFGPGPYVIPLTRVSLGVRGVSLTRLEQGLPSPRTPIVETTMQGEGVRLDLRTFSVVPEGGTPAPSNGRYGGYERLDGISGALGWATPNVPADSAFRNVAWGITRPIHYRLRVAPGAKKRVVLGFDESYKPRLFERVAWMQVEGAPDQTVDLALTARRNDPQAFLFDAADADSDGWISVEVMAPQSFDPNTTLALIRMYPEAAYLSRDVLISGVGAPEPELRIDAGTEMLRQVPRVDVIDARLEAPATAVPVVTVQTRRGLTARDGALWLGSRPFVATEPAFTAADTTAEGWTLTLPTGTARPRVLVFSGDAGQADLDRARASGPETLLASAATFWDHADIPYGHVRVPDAGIQSVLDMGLRTLYQGRETIGGRGQFNSSFTLYRGLWTGDAAYFVDLATVIGDRDHAREALDGILAHQTPEGLIEVMKPFTFWRESAMTVWTYARYARLVGDDPAERAYLDRTWPAVLRIVEALQRARQTTVGTGEPYDGLFPPAFNDGGIGRIGAEYSSVFWTMTGLVELSRVARAQGHTEDAERLDAFYTDLRASFETAFARDARRDAHGHLYVPVPVGKTGPDETPQLAQWAPLEAHLFSDYLPLDSDFMAGLLGIMQDAEREGLPISTGWLPGGVWAGFGYLYGMDLLLTGHDDRASDVLYAMANHASPVGTWVEEQPLQGEGSKLAGDMPHNWHPAVFNRMVISMLAVDRGDDVTLLGAVPEEWLVPGGTSSIEAIQTIAGPLTLSLTVSRDGRSARLRTNALGTAGQPGRLVLNTRSLRRTGFSRLTGATAGADGTVVLPWGRPVDVTFHTR